MQCCERAINTLSVRRPQPNNTNNHRMREEKRKTVGDKKGRAARPTKWYWPCSCALETRQCHTIEYEFIKIVAQHTKKGTIILRYCVVLQQGA